MTNLMLATPVAGFIATLSTDERSALLDEVVEGFAPYRVGTGMAFPHRIHVVTATK